MNDNCATRTDANKGTSAHCPNGSVDGELTPDPDETVDAVFTKESPGIMFAPAAAAFRVYEEYRTASRSARQVAR